MTYLITGGAGFIGCNMADYLLRSGQRVILLDNLSRKGSRENLDWLRARHGAFPFWQLDIRNYPDLKGAIQQSPGIEVVLHLAGQVAVTTSVANPREDFEINALGTLNLLEAIRESSLNPILLFTSTNKVYGGMEAVVVQERENRYVYRDYPNGIPEHMPLDFHSPYGCSKGAADQYVRDYARIYGLRTIVFRNSCVYGLRQFGVEDQGWVAWFVIAAVLQQPITIYGNGKQVRDVLYMDDLAAAYLGAVENIATTQGQVYNIGGGPQNTLAIWREFGPVLSELLGKPIPVHYADWRPGDQKIYVSDITKAHKDFGWHPQVGVEEGISRLFEWVQANRHRFTNFYNAPHK